MNELTTLKTDRHFFQSTFVGKEGAEHVHIAMHRDACTDSPDFVEKKSES